MKIVILQLISCVSKEPVAAQDKSILPRLMKKAVLSLP